MEFLLSQLLSLFPSRTYKCYASAIRAFIKFFQALFFVSIIFFTTTIFATPQIINDPVKNAELVGSGVLRYWMFSVYKASLYAKEGKYNGNPPYALSIEYFRSFSKESIAKRTIEEMQKQGYKNKQNLEKWYELLVNIYPDIKKQDRLTAIALTNGNSIFYHDNKFIGQINSAEFTEKFFAIWLSNKTSEPRLREKLLGID